MLKKILISVFVVLMVAYGFAAPSFFEAKKLKNSYEGYSKATKPKKKVV